MWNGKLYDQKDNKLVNNLNKGTGYVKEYFSEKVVSSEGQYINGEKNGEGKEYYFNGKLLFEGEYLNNRNLVENIII